MNSTVLDRWSEQRRDAAKAYLNGSSAATSLAYPQSLLTCSDNGVVCAVSGNPDRVCNTARSRTKSSRLKKWACLTTGTQRIEQVERKADFGFTPKDALCSSRI